MEQLFRVVKASERLPEFESKEKAYIVRYGKSPNDFGGWDWDSINEREAAGYEIEWLEPIAPIEDKEWIGFNLNNHLLVRLKPEGFTHWQSVYNKYLPDDWKKPLDYFHRQQVEIDGQFYVEFQAWVFMQVFGSVTGNGFDNPYETNILIKSNELDGATRTQQDKQLEKENEDLRRGNESLKEINEGLRLSRNEYMQGFENKVYDISQLEKELAEVRGDNEKLSDELNMNKMLLNAWENRYKELEQQLTELQKENEVLKNKIIEDEKHLKETISKCTEDMLKQFGQQLTEARELLKSLDAYGGLGHSTHNKIKEFLTQSNKPA